MDILKAAWLHLRKLILAHVQTHVPPFIRRYRSNLRHVFTKFDSHLGLLCPYLHWGLCDWNK